VETKAHLVEKEAASNARLSWMQGTKPVHLLVVPKLLQRNATLRKDVGADWLYALRCFELPEGCYYDAMRPLRLPT